MFGSKSSINVIRLSENRTIRIKKVPQLGPRFLLDSARDVLLGWVVNRDFIAPIHGMGHKQYTVCDDRSGLPLSPYAKVEVPEPAECAREAYNFLKAQEENQNHKQWQSDILLLVIVALAAGVVVTALILRFRT